MKVKEESEKAGLKFNIENTKIMASSPITSWQIDGETVTDFIFLGCKITADVDGSHDIKRLLFLGRKATTNLDSILKSILGMQPGALPFPRKELSPLEDLAVCTPPAPTPSARTPGS